MLTIPDEHQMFIVGISHLQPLDGLSTIGIRIVECHLTDIETLMVYTTC